MTTIVFRDGILASDSKMSFGGVYAGNFKKVFKVTMEESQSLVDRLLHKPIERKEYLVGAAGSVPDIQEYLDYIFEGGREPNNDLECSILTIEKTEDGGYDIQYYGGGARLSHNIGGDYYAMGSGADIAYGALYHGASAEQAVRAAIHHDNGSGGAVQIVSFED